MLKSYQLKAYPWHRGLVRKSVCLFLALFLTSLKINDSIAQESPDSSQQFLLTCEGEALLVGEKKAVKLKINKISETSKATQKEDDYSVIVNLANMTPPADLNDPAKAQEHNIRENLQAIEFQTSNGKKFLIDLRMVPEFDPESQALARLRIYGGQVKSSAQKTALSKRANVSLSSLKTNYEQFAGVSLEAVPTNFTTLELYPSKDLIWVGFTCEVM